jgi:hypothetical protein
VKYFKKRRCKKMHTIEKFNNDTFISFNSGKNLGDTLEDAKKILSSCEPEKHTQKDGEFEMSVLVEYTDAYDDLPDDEEEDQNQDKYSYDEALKDGFYPLDEDPPTAEEYERLMNGESDGPDYEEDLSDWEKISVEEWEEMISEEFHKKTILVSNPYDVEFTMNVYGGKEEIEVLGIYLSLETWNSFLDFLLEYGLISKDDNASLKL